MLVPPSKTELATAPAVSGGWRHARRRPSLQEVFGTIATRPTGSFWRKLVSFLGPGYLVAVGYMDPGNWATLAVDRRDGFVLAPRPSIRKVVRLRAAQRHQHAFDADVAVRRQQ